MNLQKLLSKGHLVPIYSVVEDTIMLTGYRRKASSRKRSQRPFLLKQAIPLGKIPTNPEPTPETEESIAPHNAQMSPKTINKE